MEDILALCFIFGGGITIAMSFSPIGRAVAERIRGPRGGHEVVPDPVLYEEMERMRAELSELGERLDFTERLLAKQREVERLPGESV
ncbi:MAG: hypothetical protein ABI587_14040 [Gemmatimonadales bacterium]